jgi:hypothetical protein
LHLAVLLGATLAFGVALPDLSSTVMSLFITRVNRANWQRWCGC